MVAVIEYASKSLIKGVAYNPTDPQQIIQIEVYHNGRLREHLIPNAFRWDLKEYGAGYHGFVYQIPQGLSGELDLRIKGSNLRLQGSPIKLEAELIEARYVPFVASDLTRNKVLVLSPHPDDESLAYGGSIALHRLQGDSVRIIFLTDGSKGNRTGSYTDRTLVALRQQEARQACHILQVEEYDFWGIPDRTLQPTADLIARLTDVLTAYRPTLIYAPSPLEYHPDHRAAGELIWLALQRTMLKAKVAYSDINRPLMINTLVDISSVIQQKEAAAQAHRSQMQDYPYLEVVRGYNRYRALTISPSATYAEAFHLLPAVTMRTHPVEYFAQQQIMAHEPSSDEQPLVSIIIRTRNRPLLLKEALSCLLTQSYPNIEVVVVNDGGSDVSAVIKEFDAYFPITHEHLSPAVGRSAAANRGIELAAGVYINLLDDDDLLFSEHIEKLAAFLTYTGESFAYSDCEQAHYQWERDGMELAKPHTPYMGLDHDRDRLYLGNYIPTMVAMFRRDLWEKAGRFDESLSQLEDWDLWLRMAKQVDLHHIPGITALYRVLAKHSYAGKEITSEVIEKHPDYWDAPNLTQELLHRIDSQRDHINRLSLELQQAYNRRGTLTWFLRALRRRLRGR